MNSNLLNEFLETTKKRGTVSETSLNMYIKDILDFEKFVENKPYESVTKDDIGDYINFMETKYRENSIIRKISSLKSFYKFLVKKGIILESPLLTIIMSRKGSSNVEKKIELNELKSIIEMCPDTGKGKRDKVVITLLAETGLQITEILNLKISELEARNYKSFIVKTSNEYIIVELSEKSFLLLREYIFKYRDKVIKDKKDDKVFCDLSRQNFKQRFVNYGKKAGLTRHVLPHMIKKRVDYERHEILYGKKEEFLDKIRREYFRIGIGDD